MSVASVPRDMRPEDVSRGMIADRVRSADYGHGALDPVGKSGFLVYLMGPYRRHTVAEMTDSETVPEAPMGSWDDTTGEYSETDCIELLVTIRDSLRDTHDLNAYLATDVGIERSDIDAATQSIEFAKASNVVAFVAPKVGKNIGVGVEIGSVLEYFKQTDETHLRRVELYQERGLSSATLEDGVGLRNAGRWDVGWVMWETPETVVYAIAEFAADVANMERADELRFL